MNRYYFCSSYRVCESLYQKRREYNKILSCYWKDPARKVSYLPGNKMDTVMCGRTHLTCVVPAVISIISGLKILDILFFRS